ncbi:MAG: hypothetical protein ACKVOM_10470 [Ferruginibacter sp.]
MNEFLRIFSPTFFIVYFEIAFVAKSVVVAKQIGKNSLILSKHGGASGLIGLYFKLTMIFTFGYILLFAFVPTLYEYFLPIRHLVTL